MKKLILATAILFSPISAFSEELDIPVVPIEVAKKQLPPIKNGDSRVPQLDQSQVNAVVQEPQLNDKSVINIRPGVNEILPIAIGHLNRLVTPFENPVVNTGASESTTSWETQQNVIYIGTQSEDPVTLFITEKDSEDSALSITLIPKRIPPREITLQAKVNSTVTSVSAKAKKWETSQPYVTTLQSLLSTLAKGGIPPGYSMINYDGVLPACRQNGIHVQFGLQTISGHNFYIHIGLAENKTNEALEFDEDACADWDIAAVSVFPNLVLQPGQKTEVYLVQKRDYEQSVTPQRQSLVGVYHD